MYFAVLDGMDRSVFVPVLSVVCVFRHPDWTRTYCTHVCEIG